MEGPDALPETHEAANAPTKGPGEDERDTTTLTAELTALASLHASNAAALCAEADRKLELLLKECTQLDLECEKILEQAQEQEKPPEEPPQQQQEVQEQAPKQATANNSSNGKGSEPAPFVPKLTRVTPKPARFLPKRK
ncbi:uncharacterized protein EMH_0010810 [Eimeria mitis]|uniref:Uncharacterized protein n=1 Tax=Eimeria mitis TaxID=44415 RepID=U6K904_9EIME|nr:uncharacterized protein EMH_0010810 [Eimeria mitis]CDJ31948.1 hypothetical protein, conserved [Eimeria mitis]